MRKSGSILMALVLLAVGVCGVAAPAAAASFAEFAWGLGTSGQIGNGNASNANSPTAVTMPSGVTFESVVAGEKAQCGLDGGVAFCWGYGIDGQIGNGASNSVDSPTQVTMPGGVTFASLVAAKNTFCALSTAGAAYCWGAGTVGQIGNGAYAGVDVPTPVTMPSGGSVTFTSLTAAADTICGLGVGVPYCWGYGQEGQIGDEVPHNANTPTQAHFSGSMSSLVATSSTFCGLVAGVAYCWGNGVFGQVGNGFNLDVLSPVSAIMPTGVTFSSLAASAASFCGLTAGGVAYCWGSGQYGEIGNGFFGAVNVPVGVTMPGGGSTTFSSVTASGLTLCALTLAGESYCWGYGVQGQIGNGLTGNASVPTASTMPSGGVTFSSLSASHGTFCGLASGGAGYCWGAGSDGQVGDGTGASVDVPTQLQTPDGWGFVQLASSRFSNTFVGLAQSVQIVTFNPQGGSGTMAPQSSISAAPLNANTFTRVGYTFSGWATTLGGPVAYLNQATYPFTANATLYATWTQIPPPTRTVTFKANGGLGRMSPQSSARPATLRANTFTRPGYHFAGWATSGTGRVAYANKARYPFTADATLYARWTPASKLPQIPTPPGCATIHAIPASGAGIVTDTGCATTAKQAVGTAVTFVPYPAAPRGDSSSPRPWLACANPTRLSAPVALPIRYGSGRVYCPTNRGALIAITRNVHGIVTITHNAPATSTYAPYQRIQRFRIG